MPHIVIDDQRARIIAEAVETVEIHDSKGGCVGIVSTGFTSEDIALAKQRLNSNEQRHTTAEVLQHLGHR